MDYTEESNITNDKLIIIGISGHSLGSLIVNLKTKKIVNRELSDKMALKIAIPDIHNMSYENLEKYFQFRMNTERELPEILCQIQKNGFYAAYQHNLRINVFDIVDEEESGIISE